MIYGFDLYTKIHIDLLAYLEHGEIKNIAQLNKLRKLVKEGDMILFFNWGKGAKNFQHDVVDTYGYAVETFPDFKTSLRIDNKINQLKELKDITEFDLERVLVPNTTLKEYRVPKLSSDKVVVKIGNEHQGCSKYLKQEGDIVKTKENIVFEEFVDNARSIRILLMGYEDKDIFIVEHSNSESAKYNIDTRWLKNVDPIETVYEYKERYSLGIDNIDSIIKDAIKIAKHYKMDYAGVDYVVGQDKTGFLELNDMIGLPDDDRVYTRAKEYFRRLVDNYNIV